jgi:hypothetical protein
MSWRCSVRFSLQHSSFVQSFSVSLQAPSFVRCFCTHPFFVSSECVAVTACCTITTLPHIRTRTRTRAPHIHPFPRAYLCICNSSPFLHIRQLQLSSPAVRSRYPCTRRAIALSLIAKQSTFFFLFFFFFFLYTSA